MLSRRGLLCAMPALICAPAIVRASSLMPVKAWTDPTYMAWDVGYGDATTITTYREIYGETLRQRCATLADLVVKNNALLQRLGERQRPMTDAQWATRVWVAELP